ncbi:MAG: SAM-dependent methyltransferase [Bacteroidetes bacterium]|nr:SAM-dependent methyltransferase [Bacteroidota bacterium]
MSKGILYLMPAPLGEGGEYTIAPYLLRIIESGTHIISERGKTTRAQLKILLPGLALENITFMELPKHQPSESIEILLEPALKGNDILLFSEAGCPGVADPGAEVVRLAHRLNIKVVPMVGPSSILLALMASGLNGQRFTFMGYLPVKKPELVAQLKVMLTEMIKYGTTFLFIETPYRNEACLDVLLHQLPDNIRLCIAADLTLPGEFISTRTIQQWKKAGFPNIHKKPALFLIGQ